MSAITKLSFLKKRSPNLVLKPCMPVHLHTLFHISRLGREHGGFVCRALLSVSHCHSSKYSTFQRSVLKFSEIKQFPWGQRTSKSVSYKFVCLQTFSLPSAPHCMPVCGGDTGPALSHSSSRPTEQ